MLTIIAALLAAAQPATPANAASLGRTAWIVATVGHSEWCPAGNVRLDLATGRYQFTSRAPRRVCTDRSLRRPMQAGTLRGARLEAARAAFRRIMTEGLTSHACREGRRPRGEVIVSNGGTPVLVVTGERFTLSAPSDLTCWSDAATALHEVLDRLFPVVER